MILVVLCACGSGEEKPEDTRGEPPVAADDAVLTQENEAIEIDILGNDVGEIETLKVDIVTDASLGDAFWDGSLLIYTPFAGVSGTDSFSYTVTDLDYQTSEAVVTVDINGKPDAVDDLAMSDGTEITIDVLANDSDPDGDELTLDEVLDPTNGTASISANSITYQPESGFAGNELIQYFVRDSRGGVGTAQVTVFVNENPIAVADDVIAITGEPTTIDVLANDGDSGGDLTITRVGLPSNGTATIEGDVIQYRSNTGFLGMDAFEYRIEDEFGAEGIGVVNVRVRAGLVARDDLVSTLVNVSRRFSVLGNDQYPDQVTVSITSFTSPANGTVTQLDVDDFEFQPATDFVGSTSFSYTLTDSDGLTSDGIVRIAVVPDREPDTLAIAGQFGCRIDSGVNVCFGRRKDMYAYDSPQIENQALGWTKVALSDGHMCRLSQNGEVWCRGLDDYNQLGPGLIGGPIGTRLGTAPMWKDLEVGARHTCVIDFMDVMWCIGDNATQQLGNGVPAANGLVSITGTYSQMSLGDAHSCAIDLNKQLYCWGDNNLGQLGVGTTSAIPSPIPNPIGPANWDVISVGENHACGLQGDQLWCWGANESGQIGDDTTNAALSPVQIAGSWRGVSAGADHTCGIQQDGLYCWGANTFGQLGFGDFVARPSPTRVGTELWQFVKLGNQTTCGADYTGSIKCWGRNFYSGLGVGDSAAFDPKQVGVDDDWTAIATGGSKGEPFSCGIRNGGELYCWGSPVSGQSGQPELVSRPTRVGALSDWVKLFAGDNHVCAIRADDSIWCWGANRRGAIGDTSSVDQPLPSYVAAGFDNGDAAFDHTCAVSTAGEMWCWGDNTDGKVAANGFFLNAPTRFGSESDWTDVALTDDHSCGVRSGEMWCWGQGFIGAERLGNATDWMTVTGGQTRICAENSQGTRCFEPDAGISGDVLDLSMVSESGNAHQCGIEPSGNLVCWGEIGTYACAGMFEDCPYPTTLGLPNGFSTVSVASQDRFFAHSCAIQDTGHLWCWGANSHGEIGSGTPWRTTPTVQQ